MSWLDGITDLMKMNMSKLWGILEDREAWSAAVHGIAKSWTRLSNSTTTGLRSVSTTIRSFLKVVHRAKL